MGNLYRAVQAASYNTELPYCSPVDAACSTLQGFQLADGNLLRPSLGWALDWPCWGDSAPLSPDGAQELGIAETEVRITEHDQSGRDFHFEARIVTDLPPYYESGYPSILGFNAQTTNGVIRLVPALEYIEYGTGKTIPLAEPEWEKYGITLGDWGDADLGPEIMCTAFPWGDTSLPARFRRLLLEGAVRSREVFEPKMLAEFLAAVRAGLGSA